MAYDVCIQISSKQKLLPPERNNPTLRMKVLALLILTGILVCCADGKHFLVKTSDEEYKVAKKDKEAAGRSDAQMPKSMNGQDKHKNMNTT